MRRSELRKWLRERDETRLTELWQRADAVRHAHVGDAVHLRGLIELSSHCRGLCGYCGLRAPNRYLPRYRMSAEEVVTCARRAATLGFGTVVLQGGEDAGLTAAGTAEIIRTIKRETDLAVTLSLGERSEAELALWRDAGADRYLLRFETSNRALFNAIHPARDGRNRDRVALLRTLGALGYETGSGVMIGIPGQSHDDLARDIELFAELDLDMIGVGPYLSHPDTPMGRGEGPLPLPAGAQVGADALTTHKVVALTRLLRPASNIPSTTALATLGGPDEQLLALRRGANILMPNLTPARYRLQYQIYPEKACYYDDSDDRIEALKRRIHSIGRVIGSGRGDSPNRLSRTNAISRPQEGGRHEGVA